MGSIRGVVIRALLADIILTRCSALSVPTHHHRINNNVVRDSALLMVAISPPDLGIGTDIGSDSDENRSGAMMDTTGIALSVSMRIPT